MIEVMIERWSRPSGEPEHVWTLWRAGSRIHLGNRHGTAEEAENEAIAFCHAELGVQPDRVTRL